ncbi:sugar phosphate nucleotidyltransferase [Actinophytocola oryzae]|uniref:Glucose-1-phosphate adenylyltransferase n=1 Tax=Actinophytocola oryzae TaxID=502181 RepID=A0A4R7W1H6_9PSEU|nr:sugar phosphate nucleotidyltransferase [Actinophytocola oryzae]TDV56314.1 glucose-1-phosphate adenylyltransferase [Actinophytocola oryzae]
MSALEGVRAGLLAGGLGERMGRLTDGLCKPLVPYAASCRLVDFSLVNAVRSGVPEVVLLSLHRESDLARHLLAHWTGHPGTRIHFGPHDELLRSAGGLAEGEPLPPRPPEHGTADALLTNAEYLLAPGARDVLVQHADHVYLLDYAPMVAAHRESGADCTIGVQRIERRYVSLFGMVEVDDELRVRALVEKPAEPTSDLVFTAFGLFRIDTLREVLDELTALGEDGWQHDISKDVLPHMIATGRRVSAFPISCYWADIGTVERYRVEQLKLLDLPMDPQAMPRTLSSAAPTYLPGCNSLVGAPVPPGAVVEGSVLHPGSRVEPGAEVRGSIVLPGATVAEGVTVADSIVLAGETVTEDRHGLAHV